MFSHSRWWNETNHHQLLLHTKLAWLSVQMHSGICLTFMEKLKCSWQISYPLLKTSVTNIFLHIWFPYVRFLTSCFPSTCYSGKLRQPYDVCCKANKDFRGKLIVFQKKKCSSRSTGFSGFLLLFVVLRIRVPTLRDTIRTDVAFYLKALKRKFDIFF